eukprot:2210223-Prymnesium_polylepis.1
MRSNWWLVRSQPEARTQCAKREASSWPLSSRSNAACPRRVRSLSNMSALAARAGDAAAR